VLLILSSSLCYGCSIEPPVPVPPQPSTPATAPPPPAEEQPGDNIPPEVTIISTPENIVEGDKLTFEWTGSDDKTPTSSLTYSYLLESYDTDYSQFTSDTTTTYTELPAGTYVFYVKSKDGAGNISMTAETIEVIVAAAPQEEIDIQTPITSSLLLLPGSDVSSIAVGSYNNVIYALDSINAGLYKSDHNGYGWNDISSGISRAASWNALAISPDDPNIVAVVTDTGTEISLSLDGGASFSTTQLASSLNAGERVVCLAISPGYGNNSHEMAAGTATGSGGGRVLINKFSRFPSGWHDSSTGAPGWLPASPAAPGADVFTIKYSPSFIGDSTILAIVASGPTSSAGDTYLYAGTRDLATNNTIWNQLPGYPVEICEAGQDTPGTPLTYADIALPWDYSGGAFSQQHIYTCWTDNPPGAVTGGNSNDNVYRIDNSICYNLQLRPAVICSLAHYGPFSQGKLLAGAMTPENSPDSPGTQAYFTSNPQANCPTWQRSLKPPTGPGNARVAWSPDGKIAYCGTSGSSGSSYDQSAFSQSTNDGSTCNQRGLNDT